MSCYKHVSGWGPGMMKKAEAARQTWLRNEGLAGIGSSAMANAFLTVGTDCSGADAPIFALRELRVSFRHVWSCDRAAHCRRWIEACCRPQHGIHDNMLNRDHSSLPEISAYFCGWPCTPFSLLRHQSKFWRDPNARPFEANGVLLIFFCPNHVDIRVLM